ncbi:MAG: TolC family protein, partial [Thermoanaerobaculia bacterium]
MSERLLSYILLLIIAAVPGFARATEPSASPDGFGYPNESAPADEIFSAIDQPVLGALIADVLARNPEIAAARARAAAAEQRAPQARALPDPMAGLTAFVLAPETRVGPQRLSARIQQRFPWFGKLKLKEQAALHGAAAARAEVEAVRLRLLTETRRLYHELGFV